MSGCVPCQAFVQDLKLTIREIKSYKSESLDPARGSGDPPRRPTKKYRSRAEAFQACHSTAISAFRTVSCPIPDREPRLRKQILRSL